MNALRCRKLTLGQVVIFTCRIIKIPGRTILENKTPLTDKDQSSHSLMSLRELMDKSQQWIRTNFFSFLKVFVPCTALLVFTILLIPRKFSSTVTFFPSDSEPSLVSSLASNPLVGSFLGAEAGVSSADIILSILKSEGLRERVLKNSEILKNFTNDAGVREFGNKSETWNRFYLPKAKNMLSSVVTISNKMKGPIVISAMTDSPDLSALIANQYLSSLEDILKESKFSKAQRKQVFAENLLERRRKELEAIQKRLINFDPANAMAALPKEMITLTEQIADLVRKKAALELYRDFLGNISNDQGPRSDRLENQIRILDEKISQITIAAREQSGKMDLGVEVRPMGKIPLVGLEFYLLQNKARALEEVVLLLTKELEIARIEAARDEINIQVLDQGRIDDIPDYPNRRNLFLIGVFLSVIVSALATQRLRSRQET